MDQFVLCGESGYEGGAERFVFRNFRTFCGAQVAEWRGEGWEACGEVGGVDWGGNEEGRMGSVVASTGFGPHFLMLYQYENVWEVQSQTYLYFALLLLRRHVVKHEI